MPEATNDAQLDDVPRGPQAGGPPRGGVRPRRLRADARRRPRQLPEVPEGRRARRHLSRRPTSTSATSSTSTPAPSSPTTAVPYRPDLRFTDFSKRGARRARSSRGARRTCCCASTAGPARWPSATAPTTMRRDRVGGVERPDRARARAHDDRVPPRGHRLRRPEPAGAAEADRPNTPVVYTGLFTPRPDMRRAHQAAARHVVPREPRVPAPVHRGLGRADRRALRPRRHVRHPVHALGRRRAAAA